MTNETTPWVKSRRSAQEGSCVEMRNHEGMVEVRDTKAQGNGPRLSLTPSAFELWLRAAKEGRLDRLAN